MAVTLRLRSGQRKDAKAQSHTKAKK